MIINKWRITRQPLWKPHAHVTKTAQWHICKKEKNNVLLLKCDLNPIYEAYGVGLLIALKSYM